MNFQVTIMAHKMMAFFIIIIIIIFWKINIIEKTPGNKDQNSFVFLMGVFPCSAICRDVFFFFLPFVFLFPPLHAWWAFLFISPCEMQGVPSL